MLYLVRNLFYFSKILFSLHPLLGGSEESVLELFFCDFLLLNLILERLEVDAFRLGNVNECIIVADIHCPSHDVHTLLDGEARPEVEDQGFGNLVVARGDGIANLDENIAVAIRDR